MAHDAALAMRIRAALADRAGVTEKRMFGGIGFLLDGNLLVSASGRGGMLVRVGPEGHDAAMASPHAAAMVMGGRGMRGYVKVDAAGVATPRAVASWIERAWAHVRTLAPKLGAKRAAVVKKPSRVAPAAKPAAKPTPKPARKPKPR